MTVWITSLDRRDFELIQMDTDSLYFALSHKTLEEAIRPERFDEFEATKKIGLLGINGVTASQDFSS